MFDNSFDNFLAERSLRDHFAGQVLPAVYADYWRGVYAKEYQCSPDWRDGIASGCYAMADAMLHAREAG